MPYPQVRGEGNLTGDPDVKYLDNGSMVANASVASTQRRFNKQSNEWEDAGTTFLRLTLWNEDADAFVSWAARGMAVRYEGALVVREFETQDGGKGKSVELQYPVVTPDPKRMEIKARKRSKENQASFGDGGGGQRQGQGGGQRSGGGSGWGGGSGGGGQQGGAMKAGSGWGRTSRQGQGGGGGGWGGGQADRPGDQDPWASAPAAANAGGYDDEPPF